MFLGKKVLASIVLAGAVAAPATLSVQAFAQEYHQDRHDQRFYDRKHRDYHPWNDREDAAYRRWMSEHHRNYQDFNRLNPHQQQAYWNWRHQHPDGR